MSIFKTNKEIAQDVREALKLALPNWKFSVTSTGLSITVALIQGPLPVYEIDGEPSYAPIDRQLNPYTFTSTFGYGREQLESNGVKLTAAGFQVMEKATLILATQHWDKSDIQSDYFCCNYYMHVELGKWDKPYTVKKGN